MRFRNRVDEEKNNNVKIITSCCKGDIIPLERLSNDVFSSMILGDGFGIMPSESKFVAPVSGEVKDISENKHEITIKTDDGIIVMVSIEPNDLSGNVSVVPCVELNEHVEHGVELCNINLKDSDSVADSVTAAVIVTNSYTIPSFNIRYGAVKSTDQPVMTITTQ